MKEFTASLNLAIEVTIKAKNRQEASLMFDYIYLNISVEHDSNQEIEIIHDNLGYLENNWELED